MKHDQVGPFRFHARSAHHEHGAAGARISRRLIRAVGGLASLLGGLLGAVPAEVHAGHLNDSGQTVCIDPSVLGPNPPAIACAGSGQDGEFGRDVTHNSATNGVNGFRFRKVGPNGKDIPRDAAAWNCVRDLTTGLMWEVKTNDGGLRDMDNTYTNWGDGRAGDASAFVQSVNAGGLCGHKDWRLPSRMELQGLVDYGQAYPGPTIDAAWFPRTKSWWYWSGSNLAGYASYAWSVYFDVGVVYYRYRGNHGAVRLVRAGQ